MSRSFQDLRPGYSPLLTPLQICLSSDLRSRALCGRGSTMVVQQAGWVSQEPHLSVSEPSTGLRDALCSSSETPLPSVSPFIWLRLPSPAPAFGTHSSNTTRLVSPPGPQDTRSFMPLCLSLMRFLQLECLPAPPASSAWQAPISLSQAPPSPRKAPSTPLFRATSAPCKCFSCGTYHTVFYLFTCLSPLLDCESLRAWTVSYASLYFLRLARCLAHSRRSINVE